MKIKLTENEYLLYKIGRKNSKNVNEYYKQFYDLFRNQPERLNPEDISFSLKTPVDNWGKIWNVCDSPNSEYKENPRDMQK
jgi:hypothetical protein